MWFSLSESFRSRTFPKDKSSAVVSAYKHWLRICITLMQIRIRILFVTSMRIRILAFKWRLKTLKKCSNRLTLYFIHFGMSSSNLRGSGSILSLWCGSGSYLSIWCGSMKIRFRNIGYAVAHALSMREPVYRMHYKKSGFIFIFMPRSHT